ncbi:MAG: hypothetical protein KDC87_02270 [Planctomycetes bacterium]|nr:hypothetical protein [Planctomycetota bacterium]
MNRRFVPYFFNRGGPGKGHDEAARKFTVGKTKNPYAYFAAFKPDGTYLGETAIYADKDEVFQWLRKLLADHPGFATPTAAERAILSGEDHLAAARLHEQLGDYPEARRHYTESMRGKPEAARPVAQAALLRIARFTGDWKAHERGERALRALGPAHAVDADVERGHRLLATKHYEEARKLLQPLARNCTTSVRLAEAHFLAGVACWFLDDRDWAKLHWCFVVDRLPDDRFYMRARVAAAAESMPYPNPELGNFKSRGMIGTEHIVREITRSMRIHRRLLPEFEAGKFGASSTLDLLERSKR